jgi:hypothetical protein
MAFLSSGARAGAQESRYRECFPKTNDALCIGIENRIGRYADQGKEDAVNIHRYQGLTSNHP